MINQTKPYIIERFFDERYFIILNEKLAKKRYLKKSVKLQADGYVTSDFIHR